MRENSQDYANLFLNDVPMMDVRAPVEFNKGAFPGVANLPLMNDVERQKVGTCYKQHGQQAAIDLGQQLVSGPTRQQRIAAWADFARSNPDGFLYCFRGGLRSKICQQWLKEEAGIDYPRVIGGYKAMRGFLIDTTEKAVNECRFHVLGGMTGTGKTDVLLQLANSLDLEGHAHHRGSSFGKHATAQPAQIDFDNRLAVDILKKRHHGIDHFVVEDESRTVGSCSVPLTLYRSMQTRPLVWLEDSLANRVERILRDYVVELRREFEVLHGQQSGFALFAERLRQSLGNIARRLGGVRYQQLASIMDSALEEQAKNHNVDRHRQWIEALLTDYYDPMYVYQREKKADRIAFAGDQQAVIDYLRQNTA